MTTRCCCTPPPNTHPIGSCCYVDNINGVLTPDCVDGVDEIFCSTKTNSTFNEGATCGKKIGCAVPSNPDTLDEYIFPRVYIPFNYSFGGISSYKYFLDNSFQGSNPEDIKLHIYFLMSRTGFGGNISSYLRPIKDYKSLTIYNGISSPPGTFSDGQWGGNDYLLGLDKDNKLININVGNLPNNINQDFLKVRGGQPTPYHTVATSDDQIPMVYVDERIDTDAGYSKAEAKYNKLTFIYSSTDTYNRGGRVYQKGHYSTGAAVKAEDKEYRINFLRYFTEDKYVNPTNLTFQFPLSISDYYARFFDGSLRLFYNFYSHDLAEARYNKVSALVNVIDVQVAPLTSCALTSDGNVTSWGNAFDGGDDLRTIHQRQILEYNSLNTTVRGIYTQNSKNCLGENLEISGDCVKIENFGCSFLVWRQNNKLSIIFGSTFVRHTLVKESDNVFGGVNNVIERVKTKLTSWQNGDVEFDNTATIVLADGSCIIKENKNISQSGRKYHVLKSHTRTYGYGDETHWGNNLILGEFEAPSDNVRIKKIISFPVYIENAYSNTSGSRKKSTPAYLILWDNGQLDYMIFEKPLTIERFGKDDRYLNRLAGLYSTTEGVSSSRSWNNIKDIFVVSPFFGWGFIADENYPHADHNCVLFLNDKRATGSIDAEESVITDLRNDNCLVSDITKIDADNYSYYQVKLSNVSHVDQGSAESNNPEDEEIQILTRPALNCIIHTKNKCVENQLDHEYSMFILSYAYFTPVSFPGSTIINRSGVSAIFRSKGEIFDGKQDKIKTSSNFGEAPSIFTTEGCEDLCTICLLPFHKCNAQDGSCVDCSDSQGNITCDFDNTYPISHIPGTCIDNPCPPANTPGCCCKTFFSGTANKLSLQEPVLDDSDCAAKGEIIYTPNGDPVIDTEVLFNFKPFDDTFTSNNCLDAATIPFCGDGDPQNGQSLSYEITSVVYSEYIHPTNSSLNGTKITFTIKKLNPNVTGTIYIRGCSYSLDGIHSSTGTSTTPTTDSWETLEFSIELPAQDYSIFSNLNHVWVAGKDIEELDLQKPSC